MNDEKRTPTEQFWDAYDAMKKQDKILRDCLDGYSKSDMGMHILLLLGHGLMKEQDLDEFSDELREWVIKVRK
ncbi:hypothetical protein [Rhodohalobacter sp. 8-1]|uniref:hypothetical protein n=1 Tax=Rhodohalobacter sp. 8-1 TaxID=3131972 RepID=UPI0030EDA5EB